MKYHEVEKAVRDLVAAAGARGRRRLGAAVVERLTGDDESAEAAEAEFDDDARRAFEAAREDPAGSTSAQLREWLERIDEGTLSDGDMDPRLVFALEALDRWAAYLDDPEDVEAVARLAIVSLEEVDYRVSADLDDFLGTPEMAAEFERITALLRG
ncbi:hypothetical protein ACWEFJ_19575 [Actinosynnema sp. NPDC004786]